MTIWARVSASWVSPKRSSMATSSREIHCIMVLDPVPKRLGLLSEQLVQSNLSLSVSAAMSRLSLPGPLFSLEPPLAAAPSEPACLPRLAADRFGIGTAGASPSSSAFTRALPCPRSTFTQTAPGEGDGVDACPGCAWFLGGVAICTLKKP
eukprot:9487040-Pyramimonas_sp.AAC.1